MRFPVALLLAAAAVLGGCSGASPDPLEPPAPLTRYAPALNVELQWVRKVGDGVGRHFLRLGPSLADGVLYAASRKGRVSAFAAEDGKELWRAELGTTLGGGPAPAGDLLLLGADAEVIALERNSGLVRWRVPVSSEVLADPVRQGEVVVVRTVDGYLYGLAAGDGSQQWRAQRQVPLLSLRGIGTPLVVRDAALAGFAAGQVGAFSLQDGTALWETAIAVPRGRTELERMVDVDGQLALAEGLLFAASFQGRVAAISVGSGRLVWTRDFSSYQGLAAAGGEVYLSDADGDVWALAQGSGGTLWKQTALHRRGLSAPAVQEQALVVGDYDGYVHWLAREDGRLLARARVSEPESLLPPGDHEHPFPPLFDEEHSVLSAPVVSGDTVFAMDKRGLLAAFRVRPTGSAQP